MEVKIEELDKLSRKAFFELPMAPIEKEVTDRLKTIAKTAKIQGFRPGKAPIKVIEKQRGADIRQDVISRALQQAFIKTVEENKLEIIGEPQFEPIAPENADQVPEQIEFNVLFDIRPEINLGDLSNVEVVKPVWAVTDKEIDQTIDILRKRYPVFEATDRESQDGDQMIIDFIGELDGFAFDGGSAQNIPMIVGAGQFLPDFEKALNGKKAGETVTFDVNFPEDYGAETLAGKTAKFTATVHAVNAPSLPEVNEEFAKCLGVPNGSIEQLRKDLKANLENEVIARVRDTLRKNTVKALVKAVEIDVPSLMVKKEQQNLVQVAYQELMRNGLKVEDHPLPEDSFLADATTKVKTTLLFEHVIRTQNLEVKTELVKEKVEMFSKAYQEPEEVVRAVYENREQLTAFANSVMEDLVIEWLTSQMKVTEENKPFSDILPA